jgi:flagellar motor switch protein FliM
MCWATSAERNHSTWCEAMTQDQQNAPLAPRSGGAKSALHRKMATGRTEHQARVMTLARALRLSVAKAADDTLDMAMAALSLRTQEVTGPDLLELFDDTSLLMLLDGPQRRRAAVIMDPALVGALIQQQTMGRVVHDVGGEARAMTGTDAAICAPFLDAILERAAKLPEAAADRQGYKFGAQAEDARLLHLAMEAPLYHVIHLDSDVERGSRQGKILLCMPVPDPSTDIEDADASGAEEAGANLTKPKLTLAQTVPMLQVELSLVLLRLKLPLHRVSGLNVGDVLSLDGASFDALDDTIVARAQGWLRDAWSIKGAPCGACCLYRASHRSAAPPCR